MRQLGHVVVVGVQEAAPGRFKLRGDVCGGNETIVADLDESGGQDVQQKLAHKFHGLDGGGPAVFGAEADIVSIEAHQPLIRDTDPVVIAAEILKDVLGPAKGTLGVDDPFFAVETVLEIIELRLVDEPRAVAFKDECLPPVEFFETLEKLSAKDPGHRLDREKEAAARRDPMPLVVEPSSGHDAMGVGMESQFARPRVQHRGHAKLRPQPAATKIEQGASS